MPARELPNLGLQAFFDPGENGWDDEMNLNMLKLSVLTQGTALSKVAAEPGAPADGDVHILDETHATHPNEIAIRDDGAWVYAEPAPGWLIFNQDEGYYEKFDGAVWAELATGGGGGWTSDPVAAVFGNDVDTGGSSLYNGGIWFGNLVTVEEDGFIESVCAVMEAAEVGINFVPAIYANNAGAAGALLAEGPQVNDGSAGETVLPLDAPLAVSAGDEIWVGCYQANLGVNAIAATTGTGTNSSYFIDTPPVNDPGGALTGWTAHNLIYARGTHTRVNLLDLLNVPMLSSEEPADGDGLVYDAGEGKYLPGAGAGGGGGGALEWVATVVVGVATATISFGSIPADGEDLILAIQGRTTGAVQSTAVLMRFNGDSSAVYAFDRNNRFGSTNGTAQTSLDCGSVTGASGTAGNSSAVSVDIPNYARTTFRKSVICRSAARDSGAPIGQYGSGFWDNTAAINQIDLFLASGNWEVGSVVSLYKRRQVTGGANDHKGCHVYNNGTQSIPNGASTAITWDTEVFDTNGIHEGVTNPSRFTCPAGLAGKWEFRWSVQFAAGATNGRVTFLRKNGGGTDANNVIGSATKDMPSAGIGIKVHGTATVVLAEGDFIELFVYQDSGGAMNVGAAATSPADCNFMSAEYLGA